MDEVPSCERLVVFDSSNTASFSAARPGPSTTKGLRAGGNRSARREREQATAVEFRSDCEGLAGYGLSNAGDEPTPR
jgi:hypothetical protein